MEEEDYELNNEQWKIVLANNKRDEEEDME